jgi:exopolysaccharide biosynthesis polyprenyl glycosylphosphotransferase
MTWVAIAIVTAVVNLGVAELAGWLPWVAERIIGQAVRLVPRDSRHRYREEWLGELDVLPGRDISSLIFALRLLVRARRVGRETQGFAQGRIWESIATSSLVRPLSDFLFLWGGLVVARGQSPQAVLAFAPTPILLVPPFVTLLLLLRGRYGGSLRPLLLDAISPIVSAVSVGVMSCVSVGVLLNEDLGAPRDWVRVWLFSSVVLGVGRSLVELTRRWARSRRLVSKPVLILGAGVVGTQVARRLANHPEYGLAPIGFLDDDARSSAEVGGRDLPVLGAVEDLDEIVLRTGVWNLIVAFSSVSDDRTSRVVGRCQELGIEVSVVPRMFDRINNRVRYDTVGGLPLMSFTAVDPRSVQFAVKHAFDRALGFVLLFFLAPALLPIALAIRLSSPGPALFRQRRIGRDGRAFDLYKFRSMTVQDGRVGADGASLPPGFLLGGDTRSSVEGDDRRTRVGRFLHRSSLDELPQLLNVLRGEMSLIGPRPERPEFVELFKQDIVRFGDRHRVRSGMTGWAQVHGLRGQSSLVERVEWDNYYVANWSLGLDLKILVLTFVALLRSAE